MSAGDESARQSGGRPAPTGPGDAVRNPAQVSFWLLEPASDAAMTYFYAQLFSGPDHMIVKTARVLRERDAPNRVIRYDLAPENPKTGQGV
jgi:hypothetical protein